LATPALTLALSPEEREQPAHVSISSDDLPAIQLRESQKRGERESPLLPSSLCFDATIKSEPRHGAAQAGGERVWVREFVKLKFSGKGRMMPPRRGWGIFGLGFYNDVAPTALGKNG
jgi:hypothetical protein